MSMMLAEEMTAFSTNAGRNALHLALETVRDIFLGHPVGVFADRARVSAVAVSAHLLASLIIADPDSYIRAGAQLTGYLRDPDIMSSLAHPIHLNPTHPVWAIYNEFIDNTIADEPAQVAAPTYNDIPGFTDETIVSGIGYAVANLVQMRMGVTDESIDDFTDTYGALL
ncbi:hypothetical protein [Curtobacterium sp. MCSS17_016]|uniref:hypothetical protein n=1 Tax=Curtobacterium sp. MCSS17_016 TaxID=2175644 RepID=UPI000DA8E61A|nr:hypothetical protein [Curtobacterium sp. MCSS17_016]WIE81187.1 hypothetical protein DEJ19_018310 [Curtobacterium sp. MCSS17_016]